MRTFLGLYIPTIIEIERFTFLGLGYSAPKAWSCAQLRVFPPSLFAKLAAIATPQLRSCQAYEVTNLLWAFAEFYKYEQDTANGVVKEVRALLDSWQRCSVDEGLATSRCKSSPRPSCP